MRGNPRPDGFSRGLNGTPIVRDRAYLEWLHLRFRSGRLPVFDLAAGEPRRHPVLGAASLELHHLENPFARYAGSRKNLDCLVAPVTRELHLWLDAGPGAVTPGVIRKWEREVALPFAARLYWTYRNRDPESGELPPGSAFAAWVISRVFDEETR